MDIINFRSIKEIIRDYLFYFQQYKVFKQKAFYFGDGAKRYYSLGKNEKNSFQYEKKGYYNFLKESFLDGEKKFSIVSLGVGNASKEKELLEELLKTEYDFSFFGVDSSRDMVELANQNLEALNVSGKLICADFSLPKFLTKLQKEVHLYDKRLYAFLGSTFGNVEQSYMADILYDLLNEKDSLWLEVPVRLGDSEKENLQIFQKFLKTLSDDTHKQFFLQPLLELGIAEEDGELSVHVANEEDVDALKVCFQFRMKNKKKIVVDGSTIILLPGNSIDLLTARVYTPEGLIHFFKERNFEFKSYKKIGTFGQFLFEKK